MNDRKRENWGFIMMLVFSFSVLLIFAVVMYSATSSDNTNKKEEGTVYFNKKEGVIAIKGVNKKLNNYLFNSPDIDLSKSDYTMDEDGLYKLMDDYRNELKKLLGNDLYDKYLEKHAFKLLSVRDDKRTIHVNVSGRRFIKYDYADYDTDFGKYTYDREMKNLVMGMAYAFKNDRNIHVTIGYMGRDKYNKDVFVKYDDKRIEFGCEYVFKRSELSKVEKWEEYPFELLMELNEYKK